MQRETGISRRDVLQAYEAAARHAGVAAAVDVLLDWAEASQLQLILESLADTATKAMESRVQELCADRQPPA